MIDWLLKLDPREVQLEALRRSYRGVATMDGPDDVPFSRPVPGHPQDQPIRGWGHFAEQRIGKTPIILNEFMLLRRDYGFRWNIVLTPNSYKQDWPLEAEKFGIDCPSIAMESTKREKVQKFIDKNKNVGGLIAVNYEALIQEPTRKLLADICGPKTMITASESISLKNHTSGFWKGARDLRSLCGIQRVESGKPMSQGPHDLYTQLRFIGQLEGIEPVVFKKRHTEIGGFMGKQVVGVKDEEKLHTLLDRCSWAPRKITWLKTPGKEYPEHPILIDMLPEQAKLYQSMFKEFLIELEDGTTVSADQVITKLIKLQQIAAGFIIDEFKTIHELVPPEKNPMIRELIRRLEEEIRLEDVGGKVIINCFQNYSLDTLERMLARWQPAMIRGQDWHKKSGRSLVSEKNRYNNDPKCRIMLGQEQALRYGHTLMGTNDEPCLNMFYYENSYSLNDRGQTEERAQGSGQLSPVTIWDFIASPQMARVIEALQMKEDMVAAVMRFPRESGVLPRGLIGV